MRQALFCILLGTIGLVHGQTPAVSNAEFPFEFREGLLWVSVQIPECGRALNFLLDSGAEASVIDLQAAKELNFPLGQHVEVAGVRACSDGYWCDARSVRASGVELPNRLLALDLGKLSSSCERRVDGLIGADFFSGKTVQIDFDQSVVTLLDLTKVHVAGDCVSLKVRRCAVLAKASINGNKPAWLRLDTGCASPLQWVTGSIKPQGCTTKVAVGLTQLRIPQTRTTVKIGNATFTGVDSGLHNSPIFEGEAGLLGNGLLSRFKSVTFDAARGRLFLGERR